MVDQRKAHLDPTQARAGSTSGTVRRVLVVGLILGIIGLSAVWITGALSTGEIDDNPAVSNDIAVQQERASDDTDGLVDEGFDEFAPANETEATQDAQTSATRTVTN